MARSIILDNTTGTIQIVLGGSVTTNQLQVTAHYADITTSGGTPGNQFSSTNDTTDVDIVSAPGTDIKRVIADITVYNADTVTSTITIKHDDTGTEHILYSFDLASGATWELSTATASGGGTGDMTSFTVAGDSGTPQTISDGDTLTIAGGNGISTTASATDTITVNSSPTTQSGTPVSAPSFVGEIDVDTTNDRAFIATDTSANTDWKRADGAMVKLLSGSETSDIASLTISGWATDNRPYRELIIRGKGLRTDRAANAFDNILVQFNTDTTAANYDTQRWDATNTTDVSSVSIGNQPGGFLRSMAAGTTQDSNIWGSFELHILLPEDSNDWTQAWAIGGMGSTTDSENVVAYDRFVWENVNAISSVTIAPSSGTTFVIGDTGEPTTLEWDLYGVY